MTLAFLNTPQDLQNIADSSETNNAVLSTRILNFYFSTSLIDLFLFIYFFLFISFINLENTKAIS